MNISRGGDLGSSLGLTADGEEKQVGIFRTLLNESKTARRKRRSFVSPAPHDESPLQAVVIAGTDLILVQQLVGHLVSHRGQTAGVQVEDDCTCKAVEMLSPCTSTNMHRHRGLVESFRF